MKKSFSLPSFSYTNFPSKNARLLTSVVGFSEASWNSVENLIGWGGWMQSARMLKLGLYPVYVCVCVYMYTGRRKGVSWWEEEEFACRRTFSCLWNEPSSFEGTWIDRALPLKGLITMENATVSRDSDQSLLFPFSFFFSSSSSFF